MRTILSGFAVVGAMLIAAPAQAFEPTTDAEKLLVGWLEEAGCAMTQKDFMSKMMSGPGVSGSDMMKTRRQLTQDGVIAKGSGNSMTLTAGAVCAGTETAEPKFDSGSEEDILVRKLIATFENNNCVMTERSALKAFEDQGMTREQLDIAGEALEDAGAFDEVDAGLLLTFGKCKDYDSAQAPADQSGKRAIVIGVFEQNGCKITRDQSEKLFPAAGLSLETDRDLVRGMISAGDISLDRGTGIATYTKGPVCGTANAASGEVDARETIIAMFERNDCLMTQEMAKVDFQKAGLDLKRDGSVIEAMFENGELVEGAGDSARLTIGETCKDWVDPMRSLVISIFEANDCVLTEDSFEVAMKEKGLDPDDLEEIGEAMMEAGEITFDAEINEARLLTGDVCEQ